MEDVVRRALDAILDAQDQDGQWRDFEIPEVGVSDAWVTAHVGLKLRSMPEQWQDVRVRRALSKAVDGLQLDAKTAWSYSDRSPADTDSTAHVVLFLNKMGRTPPDESLRFLLDRQQPDGGFATFLPRLGMSQGHSWTTSHPDVTAVVVQALWPFSIAAQVADSIRRARQYMTNVNNEEQRWPAFWWSLDWFTAAYWIEALKAMDGKLLRAEDVGVTPAARVRSDLDAGLLLQALTSTGACPEAQLLVSRLAERQLGSGLWPTLPVLRVTRPHVSRPWLAPNGCPLYADRGVYSAATIGASIARHISRGATDAAAADHR